MNLTQWINDGPSKRFAVRAVLAAFIAGAVLALVGIVAPDVAKAGGSGNWYKSRQCSARSGTLVGKATNYDVDNYQNQEYHFSANSVSGFYPNIIIIDDESWPITPSEIWDALSYKGTKSNGYQKFDIMATLHWLQIFWTNGKTGYSCYIAKF
jgi:hypothetical protein